MREVPPVRIGIDIGGTFTDLQIFDARSGAIFGFKTPTTPEDPSIGLMTGIKQAADRYGFALADVGFLLHGTTIATNASPVAIGPVNAVWSACTACVQGEVVD